MLGFRARGGTAPARRSRRRSRAGLCVGGGREGSIDAHVEEFCRHVDRVTDMGFHARVKVTSLRRSGLRAAALKVRKQDGMMADPCISKPGAKEDLSDWT